MSTIQEIIRKKQDEIAAKKAQSLRTIKPEKGRHQYRILPGWAIEENGERSPVFWQDFGQHFIKKDDNSKPLAVYVCSERVSGKECPICNMIGQAVSSATSDAMKDRFKINNSRQVHLINVLHRTAADPNMRNVPQTMEIGATIFEQICEMVIEYGDITSLEDGRDLIIKREGTGFDTTYSVLAAKDSEKVSSNVLDKLNNLLAYASQESPAGLSKAIAAASVATGISAASLPAPTSSAVAAISASDFDPDEDVSIGEPAVETKKAKSPTEEISDAEFDDLDELDNLLDQLDNLSGTAG